jgi:hypothetical protein
MGQSEENMTPPLFSDFISSFSEDTPRRKTARILKAESCNIRTIIIKSKTRARLSVLGREA